MTYTIHFRTKIMAALLPILLFAVSCSFSQQSAHDEAGLHRFTVKEVIQTTSYTYLLAQEKEGTQWLAVPKINAKVGQDYFYEGGMEMRDFESKELGRIFESVLFLNGVISADANQASATDQSTTPSNNLVEIETEKPEDAITLAELFANKTNYANRKVKIHGKVVKYNSGIMGKNWIHLQDGTEYSGKNDLTITTNMATSLNETITIEGTIVLDKDFGSGYFYQIILEEGIIIK